MKRISIIGVTLSLLMVGSAAFAQTVETSEDNKVASVATSDWDVEPAVVEIDGTWNVTVKPTGFDTCRRGKPKLRVYQWLVSTDEENVAIEVIGGKSSAFAKLNGRVRNGRMYLAGSSTVLPEGENVRPSVVHKLRKLNDRKFTGEHHLLGATKDGTACMTSYLVKLEKQ